MLKLNWNDVVYVKLTDFAKDIYYHQYDRLIRMGCNIKPTYPEVDERGFSKFQVWDFMRLYGGHIGMTLPEIVEDLNFYIDKETLKEVEI